MNIIIIIFCAIIAVTWIANFFHKRKKTKEVEYNKKMRHFQELTTQATDEELILILIRADEYQPEFVELVKKELENVRNIKSYKDFFNDKPIEEIIDFCNQPKNYPEEFIELAKQELIERNVDFDFEEPKPLEFMEQINCFQTMQKDPFENTEQAENNETESKVNHNEELNRTTKRYYMRDFKAYLNRIGRISVNYSKYENLVWKDLKKYFALTGFNYGIFEKEKCIEALFEIEKGKGTKFYYRIADGYSYCQTFMFEGFPIELTTDFFILATHFNNLLNGGIVRINVEERFVEYCSKREILIPLLYKGEIHNELFGHYNASIDIFWAFQKLVEENEEPAIIFADLMKRIDERAKTQE